MPNNPTPLAEAPVTGEVSGAEPETRKVHAALTRSSTGNEDLRELESGLDSLQSDAARAARIDWSRVLLPVAALVVLVLAWQFYVSLGLKRRDLVPGPLDVLGQFGTLWAEGSLQEAVWTSLQRGLIASLGMRYARNKGPSVDSGKPDGGGRRRAFCVECCWGA